MPSIFSCVEENQHSLARAGRAKSRGIKRELAVEFSSLSSVDEAIYTSSDDLQVSEEIVSSSTQNFRWRNSSPCSEILHSVLICKNTYSSVSPMRIDNFTIDDAGVNFYTGLETLTTFYFVLRTLGPAAHCLNYIYRRVSNIGVPDQFT